MQLITRVEKNPEPDVDPEDEDVWTAQKSNNLFKYNQFSIDKFLTQALIVILNWASMGIALNGKVILNNQ